MLIEKYLGYNPLQSPSKSQLLHSMGDARWIQPVMETAGLGRIYGGRGIFKATDTKRDTIVIFLSNTNTLTYDDVSASYAAIGYNRDGTPL